MEHWALNICNIEVNLDTLLTMWAVMLFLIICAFVLTRNLSVIPTKLQVVGESIMGFVWGLVDSNIGEDEGRKHVPLVASLFLFIVTANLMGQLPLKLIEISHGELASPTNDINMTAAMAVIVLIYYVSAGIKKKGFKFFIHGFGFAEIIEFLIELLDMVTRPLTLALRLFGNVMAGEFFVGAILGLCAYGIPVLAMFFEVLVAVIQAFVFTMLTIVYISSSVAEDE